MTGVTSPILSARATTPLPRTAARPSRAAAATDEHAGDDAGASLAEAILDECHRSARTFRIVVVGNGAILETTSRLGPTSKASASPTTGERLLTFASDDRSFEFHVKVEQVGKVAFVAAKRRVARFLTRDGAPVCSLILMDEANEGAEWFDGLVEKYGSEVVV